MNGVPMDILLVEDNLDHAELVIRSLRGQGVTNRLHHVTDGEAALDYLFRRGAYADPEKSPRPQVILLDLRLPKVDGLGVLKAIKPDPLLRRIPVVILTTSDEERDVARAYDCYTNSYLVKPADYDKFLQLMNDLGEYWLRWNCPPILEDLEGYDHG
jgi:two-component system, response regulator